MKNRISFWKAATLAELGAVSMITLAIYVGSKLIEKVCDL